MPMTTSGRPQIYHVVSYSRPRAPNPHAAAVCTRPVVHHLEQSNLALPASQFLCFRLMPLPCFAKWVERLSGS